MTTIVYDHKNRIIACDGRLMRGLKIRSENYQKWRETKEGVAFFAGTVADIDTFSKMMGVEFDKFPVKTDTTCLLVRDGKVYECSFDSDDGYFEIEMQFNAAIGSGGALALSALDFGCSAKDAVKYAHSKDAGTGGEVYVYDIDKGEFL